MGRGQGTGKEGDTDIPTAGFLVEEKPSKTTRTTRKGCERRWSQRGERKKTRSYAHLGKSPDTPVFADFPTHLPMRSTI